MFAALIISFIRFYRLCISPFTRPSCRFYPTCSEYAIYAIQHHGLLKGANLAVRRLLRCRPFEKSYGFDPVPSEESLKQS